MQKGHVFFLGRSWENMFLMHGCKSARFISVHLIFSQQGPQEISLPEGKVSSIGLSSNIYDCSMKVTLAEYESLEKYIIITSPPVCTSWSPLTCVEFLTLVYLREWDPCSFSWTEVLFCEMGLMVVVCDGKGLNCFYKIMECAYLCKVKLILHRRWLIGLFWWMRFF